MEHPLLLLLLLAASIRVFQLWVHDLRAASSGRPNPNGFPGTTLAPTRSYVIAICGTLALLAIETIGEIKLGIANEQSRITALFAVYTVVGAPVIEELIFRGWLVVEQRGQFAMWAAAVGASAAFAALHPLLWRWDDQGFGLTLGLKGWFSAAIVFALSLWLYVVRISLWNPQRSLLPCFVAHAVKNLGVVAIKAGTGFIGGWW